MKEVGQNLKSIWKGNRARGDKRRARCFLHTCFTANSIVHAWLNVCHCRRLCRRDSYIGRVDPEFSAMLTCCQRSPCEMHYGDSVIRTQSMSTPTLHERNLTAWQGGPGLESTFRSAHPNFKGDCHNDGPVYKAAATLSSTSLIFAGAVRGNAGR